MARLSQFGRHCFRTLACLHDGFLLDSPNGSRFPCPVGQDGKAILSPNRSTSSRSPRTLQVGRMARRRLPLPLRCRPKSAWRIAWRPMRRGPPAARRPTLRPRSRRAWQRVERFGAALGRLSSHRMWFVQVHACLGECVRLEMTKSKGAKTNRACRVYVLFAVSVDFLYPWGSYPFQPELRGSHELEPLGRHASCPTPGNPL